MFLQEKQTGTLVQILHPEELFNPTKEAIAGQVQEGQEEQQPAEFKKENLKFPSGEDLPRCWIDENYRTA